MYENAKRATLRSAAFFQTVISPKEARFRLPPGEIANPRQYFQTKVYSVARRLIAPLSSPPLGLQDFLHDLHSIGFAAAHSDHPTVVQLAHAMLAHFPDSPIPAVYGYISSLFNRDEESTMEFFQTIASINFDAAHITIFHSFSMRWHCLTPPDDQVCCHFCTVRFLSVSPI
jgi:hypothetical protein